jgi:hypothetical protein
VTEFFDVKSSGRLVDIVPEIMVQRNIFPVKTDEAQNIALTQSDIHG